MYVGSTEAVILGRFITESITVCATCGAGLKGESGGSTEPVIFGRFITESITVGATSVRAGLKGEGGGYY